MNYWVKQHAGCIECGRRFDLMVKEEADEWYHGHDCEVEDEALIPKGFLSKENDDAS